MLTFTNNNHNEKLKKTKFKPIKSYLSKEEIPLNLKISLNSLKSNCLRCPDCSLIPSLFLDNNADLIYISCNAGHINTMKINEYIKTNTSNTFQDKLMCYKCLSKFTSKNNSTVFYCQDCKYYLCKSCEFNHNKKHKISNIGELSTIINTNKFDTTCFIHNKNFSYFCNKCKLNLCQNCYDINHKNHPVVKISEISKHLKISDITSNFKNEQNIWTNIENLLNNIFSKIKEEIDDLIENKKTEIKFKEYIIKMYEKNKYNYNTLKNIKNLEFDTTPLKIDNSENLITQFIKIYNYLYKDNKSQQYKIKNINDSNNKLNNDYNVNNNSKNKTLTRNLSLSEIVQYSDKKLNEQKINNLNVNNTELKNRSSKLPKIKPNESNINKNKNNILNENKKNNYIKKKNTSEYESSSSSYDYETEEEEESDDSTSNNYKFINTCIEVKKSIEKKNYSNSTRNIIQTKENGNKVPISLISPSPCPQTKSSKIKYNSILLTEDLSIADKKTEMPKKNDCYNYSYQRGDEKIIKNDFVPISYINKNKDKEESKNSNEKIQTTHTKQTQIKFLFDHYGRHKKIISKKIDNGDPLIQHKDSKVRKQEIFKHPELDNKNLKKERLSCDTLRSSISKNLSNLTTLGNIYINENNSNNNISNNNDSNNISVNNNVNLKKEEVFPSTSSLRDKESINDYLSEAEKDDSIINKEIKTDLINNNNDKNNNKEIKNNAINNNNDKNDDKEIKNNIINNNNEKNNINNNEIIKNDEKNIDNINNNDNILTESNDLSLLTNSIVVANIKEVGNTVSALLDLPNNNYFACGFLYGEIDIYDSKEFSPIMTIEEHKGRISNLANLKDGRILSVSFDGKIKKINIFFDKKSYLVDFIFNIYESIVYKAIELGDSEQIISISFGSKITVWNKISTKAYTTLIDKKINEEDELLDILYIKNFVIISTNNSIKFFDINKFDNSDNINDLKISVRNNLILLNEKRLGILLKNGVGIIDIENKKIVNIVGIPGGKIETMNFMKNNTILLTLTNNKGSHDVSTLVIKQYEYKDNKLFFIDEKEDIIAKKNSEDFVRVSSLIELKNGLIAFGTYGTSGLKLFGNVSVLNP